jgi:uncharacterized integral membrane protein
VTGAPTPAGGGRQSWRLWVAVGAIVLAAIFILQNSQDVTVDFLFTTAEAPLVFALLFAMALGFVIGLALPRFRQPRRGHDE